MYVNLHTLPPGRAMYTLYVGQPGQPDLEEYDQVGPARAPEHRHLAALVIEEAKDALVELYGDKVEVRIVTSQSVGDVIYTSGQRGFRPIPVVPGPRLVEAYADKRYDVIIDLCRDEADGLGGAEYLDWLLDSNPADFVGKKEVLPTKIEWDDTEAPAVPDEALDFPRCPACHEPIDYCQGHGEIGDPEGRAILDAEMEV